MKIRRILWAAFTIAMLVVWGHRIFILKENTFLNWFLFIGGIIETIHFTYIVLKKKYEK